DLEKLDVAGDRPSLCDGKRVVVLVCRRDKGIDEADHNQNHDCSDQLLKKGLHRFGERRDQFDPQPQDNEGDQYQYPPEDIVVEEVVVETDIGPPDSFLDQPEQHIPQQIVKGQCDDPRQCQSDQ